MIGWIILGLIVGLTACLKLVDLFHGGDDPWKAWVNCREYEDQIEEAEQDHWDWQMKQGKYAGRSGE